MLGQLLESGFIALDPTPAFFSPLPGEDPASKEAVIKYLVEGLATKGVLHNPVNSLEAILEREALGSTEVGDGIFIPHCRTAGVDKLTLAFARCGDSAHSRLLFLVVAPEKSGSLYLKVLARIARALREGDTIEQLRLAPKPARVIEILSRFD